MDKISDYMRKSGSFSSTMGRRGDVSLPMHIDAKPRTTFQLRALLGHCLYRRVVIWIVLIVVLLTSLIFKPRWTTQSRNVLDIAHGNKVLVKEPFTTAGNVVLQNQDSAIIDLPVQEAIYEVQLGEVEVNEVANVEEAANVDQNAPNGTPNNETNDIPNNSAESIINNDFDSSREPIPESMSEDKSEDIAEKVLENLSEDILDSVVNEEPPVNIANQEEDTSEEEENADWPKWLKYKQ
ncbi:hypothetical protein RRF57_004360 [Xylaria bambusicola]|uniref:Uncharacterized protein n=1 Tax=Xylaria bambusicola TaxID=326684 RepID=A0AAN7UAI0_9PEZI